MFRKIIVLSVFFVFLFGIDGEWSYDDIKDASTSVDQYFDNQDAPDVYVDIECPENGNGECWSVIKNQKDRIFHKYSPDYSVVTIAKGRYNNIAYLFYGVYTSKHSYYYLIDNNGKSYAYDHPGNNYFDIIINKEGKFITVKSDGIYKNGYKILPSKMILEDGVIQNNLNGDIAVIARTKANNIITSNTKAWSISKNRVTSHGDKKEILSVFPKDSNSLVYAFYRYVNPYNKGVITGKAEFEEKKDFSGWIVNSEIRNIGFSPEIFIDKNNLVHIIAKDSSNEKNVEVDIPYSKINKLQGFVPKHIKGLESENDLSFIVGASLNYYEWKAQNKIEGEYGSFNASLDYDIAANTFLSYYMQGRYKNTQLSVTYLRNKAEKKYGINNAASSYLFATFDFNNIFSSTSTLRIGYETGNINAISRLNTSGDSTKIYNYSGDKSFSNKLNRYYFLIMQEKGIFYGFEYTKYKMPSLLGYGKKGNVKFGVFDPETNIQKYTIKFGYDKLYYAKRYETVFSRFYYDGSIEGGIGYINASDNAQNIAKNQAQALGYSDISYPISFVVGGVLNVGYLYQNRVKYFHGLGISSQIGFRVKGLYYISGSSKDTQDNSNDLSFEFQRYDLRYGPYISINLIL